MKLKQCEKWFEDKIAQEDGKISTGLLPGVEYITCPWCNSVSDMTTPDGECLFCLKELDNIGKV